MSTDDTVWDENESFVVDGMAFNVDVADQPEFREWLERILGKPLVKRLFEDGDSGTLTSLKDAWAVMDSLGHDGNRDRAARLLIERFVPHFVDRRMWENLAKGENFSLQESAQFGVSKPSASAARRQNDYGRVHTKGDMAPAQFMQRQGDAVARQAAKVKEAEERLEAERLRMEEMEAGLKAYAATCLLTRIRKVAGSVFALGPSWTVMQAIAGPIGDELSESEQSRDTYKIMTVLHALKGHTRFEQSLKRAILGVCLDFRAEVANHRRVFSDFDGPYDAEYVLNCLEAPEFEEFFEFFRDRRPDLN